MPVFDGGEADRLAPVIPLFGGDDRARADERPSRGAEWANTWRDEPTSRAAARSTPTSAGASADETDQADVVAAAESALVRRLRGRQLSVSEARAFLREREVVDADADSVLDRCLDLGYLDDGRLAEQLVHAAVSRKGQGRHAVALALSKRGIGRDVADGAMTVLPDDEQERALDFARSRARQMRSLDRDVALRRLAGQLARRGFASHMALSAARSALDETV